MTDLKLSLVTLIQIKYLHELNRCPNYYLSIAKAFLTKEKIRNLFRCLEVN